MRTRITVLALILVFLLGITAQASGPLRSPEFSPALSFSGSKAICSAYVDTNKHSDKVIVTMTLSRNGIALGSWTKSGDGVVSLTKEYSSVLSGKTYKLGLV